MKAVEGDVTGLKVDAIVNTANTSLLGGGGVDDGYPCDEAAKIAVNTVKEHSKKTGYEVEVTFCCLSKLDLDIYGKLL